MLLHSSSVKTPRARAVRALTEANRNLLLGFKALMETELRGQGLTLAQLRLLIAADEHSGASAAEIARHIGVTPQTLQSMLVRAAREHWITRGSSPTNHRIVTVSLAPAGRAILETGQAMAAEIEARLWNGVPMAEVQQAQATLSRALANLERALKAGA
jgi:DNA-binding MarR family transcriptional regulator